MHVEDFDLSTYPIKSMRNPQGEPYKTPQPASHIWKVTYLTSTGETRWDFCRSDVSSATTEIPYREIVLMEKRFIKPQKIVAVHIGLIHHQNEPGGPWERTNPNDKDPRAEHFYEGQYTELYINKWRPEAYKFTGEFDALKLTRTYSKEEAYRIEMEKQAKELEALRARVAVEIENANKLKAELAKKS